MSSHGLYISSPPCTYANASDYVSSLLCATLLVGSVSGAVLKLDQFFHSSFSVKLKTYFLVNVRMRK